MISVQNAHLMTCICWEGDGMDPRGASPGSLLGERTESRLGELAWWEQDCFLSFFFFNSFYLFWPFWVFVAARAFL